MYPPELEPDVRFWIRVYTEVGTDQGLLHDDRHLGLVYEVLNFDPDLSPELRQQRVNEARSRYAALLRRFAAGDTENLTLHERRILHAFGDDPTPAQFRDAIGHIRFQLGQADRFHEGLQRAAAWETHIAGKLRELGLPEELAALPHVESSFNIAAYSRVGAAGLWQFMPSTARRFMRVDNVVDQRLDPYSATEAAANLMLYNYRLLGSWPLTVTAYNHGPGGLRRAQDELGTSDIAVVVRRYQGPTFGFASRNFYVAFLAALEVDRHAEGYFGAITHLPNTESWTTELPDYMPVAALAKAFNVDLGALQVLNPALRPPVWDGSRFVPRGYALRLPGVAPSAAHIAAVWASVPAKLRYLAQRNDGSHRLRRGESLASVAAQAGVSLTRLMAANGLRSATEVGRGRVLKLPLPPSRADQAGTAAASADRDASVAAAAVGGAAERTALAAAMPAGSAAAMATPTVVSAAPRSVAESAVAPAPIAAVDSGVTTAPASMASVSQAILYDALPIEASLSLPARGRSTLREADYDGESGGAAMAVAATAGDGPASSIGSVATGAAADRGAAIGLVAALRDGAPFQAVPIEASLWLPARAGLGLREATDRDAVDGNGAPVLAGNLNAGTINPSGATAGTGNTSAGGATDAGGGNAPAGPTDVGVRAGRIDASAGDDTEDYRVAGNGSVVVQPDETLGQLAEWSGVNAARLRELNHLRRGGLELGRKITLDLSHVSAAEFEASRRDYHKRLQEAFFASHRVAGTQSYPVKRGESLWTIAHRRPDLPIWLVAEYNPDVDFNDVRPGTSIAMPLVVAVNR